MEALELNDLTAIVYTVSFWITAATVECWDTYM